MKKLFRTRNNRALSTVLSTVLMVLVVMVGMSLLFAYIAFYSQNFHEGSGSAVLESITVEDVYFTSANNANVTIYNTGKVDFVITSVYIDSVGASTSLNLEVKQGQHEVLEVPGSFSHSQSYVFKLVTQRGTILEGTYVW
jgi:hypothetical protein